MSIEIIEGFPEWAWPMAFEWAEKRRSQFADDFFPRTADALVELSKRWCRTFGVWKDGSLGGAIAFEMASAVSVTAHILLSKRLWGVSPVNLCEAGRMLFESCPELVRIQAPIPEWNRLAVALAVRMGGTVEGVMRAASTRNGVPVNAVLVGITREEFNRGILRGIGRLEQQQLDQQQRHAEDVLGSTDAIAGSAGNVALQQPGSGIGWDLVAGSDGREDSIGGCDQHGSDRATGPNDAIPRPKRVREKRRDRKGGTVRGAGKASGTGSQRSKRGGAAGSA